TYIHTHAYACYCLRSKTDGSCTAACPYGWVKFDNRCFTYFASPLDWYSAEIYCVNLGANLASMHNENEYQMVKSLIRAHDPDENPAWIGLSGEDSQKDQQMLKFGWVWSDGTRFDFTRWNSNEPNYSNNGECCVNINWASGHKVCRLRYIHASISSDWLTALQGSKTDNS
uniref:C-type lectin domain-containing protein n=1 Tax=Astyanax mexicanus TaxID=7994 RepID=A0A8B9H5L8_ASTMX